MARDSPWNDPDFAIHRHWIEDTLRTPTPQSSLQEECYPLTGDLSPTEHVLRGTRSFAARSFRSRNALNNSRIPSDHTNDENVLAPSKNTYTIPQYAQNNNVLNDVANNSQVLRPISSRLRPSPTPSIKRKKAEAIVKAHGSPTHLRVTAGGRIVPSEQSPLCFPRFGYSAVKANGGLVKFAPNHPIGKAAQWTQNYDGMQNGLVAQDTEGRLCQIVNGIIMPLTEVDGAVHLHIPAPNLNITQRGFSGSNAESINMPDEQARSFPQPAMPVPIVPSVSAQISALDLEYRKLGLELRDLDKTEVIHSKTMAKTAKDALVSKRRELVMSMDKIRRALKSLKEREEDAPTSPVHSARSSVSPPNNIAFKSKHNYPAMPFSASMQPMFGVSPFPMHSAISSMSMPAPEGFAGSPYMMPPPNFFQQPGLDGMNAWYPPFPIYQDPAAQLNMPLSHQADQPRMVQSDGTASAVGPRSRSPQVPAVTLKDPDTKQVINLKSHLNPMSPVYKPNTAGLDDVVKGRDASVIHNSPDHVETRRAGRELHQDIFHPLSSSPASSISIALHNKHTASGEDTGSDKENQVPAQENFTISQADLANKKAEMHAVKQTRPGLQHLDSNPAAPPGTPIEPYVLPAGHIQHQHTHFGTTSIPDRQTHNLSPKGKRSWLQDAPQSIDGASSSVVHVHNDRASTSGNATSRTVDFSEKSYDWIEGYQAGLHQQPVDADRAGDFMDGYCSGLLKSKHIRQQVLNQSNAHSVASLHAPATDKTSPSYRSSRPPLESSMHSTDCLKQTVEDDMTSGMAAVSIHESSLDLPAWQKHHEHIMAAGHDGLARFTVPERNASIAGATALQLAENSTLGQQFSKEGSATPTNDIPGLTRTRHQQTPFARELPPLPSSEGSIKTDHNLDIKSRIASTFSSSPINANAGKRIVSPAEWRNSGSIANVANLSTSLFTNAQFDGIPAESQIDDAQSPTEPANAPASPKSNKTSRFKEASLDGLSPPGSPLASPSFSPPLSPCSSPVKLSRRRTASKESLSKRQSPTRSRMDQITGKFKSSPDKTGNPRDSASPAGKPRWRDIWKGARRD